MQSLGSLPDAELQNTLARFGQLVVDECHRAAAPSYLRVLDVFPGRYRVGLTATPARADGTAPVYAWRLGVEQITVTVSANHVVVPRLRCIENPYKASASVRLDRDGWYGRLISDMARNSARNAVLVDEIAALHEAGRTVLVLTGLVAHAEQLVDELAKAGVEAVALSGRARGRKRDFERFRGGEVRVCVATQLADEGLDVPILDAVVLALPSRSEARLTQRVGRVMRTAPGKSDAIVISFEDPLVPMLRGQTSQRRTLLERLCGAP